MNPGTKLLRFNKMIADCKADARSEDGPKANTIKFLKEAEVERLELDRIGLKHPKNHFEKREVYQYQRDARDWLRAWILKLLASNRKKSNSIMEYVDKLVTIDRGLASVKLSECSSDVDEIVSRMEVLYEKQKEIQTKYNNIDSEILETETSMTKEKEELVKNLILMSETVQRNGSLHAQKKMLQERFASQISLYGLSQTGVQHKNNL